MIRRTALVLLVLGLVPALSACQAARALSAWSQGSGHLVALAADPRVRYEPGAEDLARQAAAHLPEAINQVEEGQFRKFTRPVEVRVYATVESYSTHSGAVAQTRGASFNGAVHLSPLLRERSETLPAILTHELSHLHCQQHLGTFAWASGVPSWFSEGLAVMVSGGAGAEKVTEAEALRAMEAGSRFTAETTGSLLFARSASSYGLQPHMYYRQAGLFVSHLRARDPAAFRAFLSALLDKTPFAEAFAQAYRESVEEAWRSYLAGLRRQPRVAARLD